MLEFRSLKIKPIMYVINVIGFIILSILPLLTLISCTQNNTAPIIPKNILQQGDIVFRRGEGIISEIVIRSDVNGMYSHIGVIVEHNGSLKVVHAVPGEPDHEKDFDRVKLEPIDQFFSPYRSARGEVKRIELTDSQSNIIRQVAMSKVNDKIKFDHDYNLNDTTELYCTELVQLVFSHVGINLSENRTTKINVPGMSGDYIMPSDIYENEKLISIYKY